MAKRTMAVLVTGFLAGSVGVAASSSGASAAPARMPQPAPGAAAASATALPADLVAIRTLSSLTGTHRWYAQTFRGLPVLDGYYAVHTARTTAAVSIDDGRVAVPTTLATTPLVSAAAAVSTTSARVTALARQVAAAPAPPTGAKTSVALPIQVHGATLSVLGGPNAALVWSVVADGSEGVTRTLVDARTGVVRGVIVVSKAATGQGQVFTPNPVVTLRNEALTDRNDADQAVLVPAYRRVTLRNLTGTGTLVGTAARIVAARGGLATSPTNTFVYTRADDRFEQVMAYYGIDLAQTYLRTLGFTDANNESQDVAVDTIAADNSFYDPTQDTITYGRGGVDDAEDLEVVWHEYGHAIQDAIVPGFGSSLQAGSIGEGFGDYWAATMSVPTSGGYDLPCVMDWDSTSYTTTTPHCIRRLDTTKTVADTVGEVHADGEIWSRALWDIHKALGRLKANTVIIESTYAYTPNTTFAAAARKVVATARTLYGDAAATAVTTAFHSRGIL